MSKSTKEHCGRMGKNGYSRNRGCVEKMSDGSVRKVSGSKQTR